MTDVQDPATQPVSRSNARPVPRLRTPAIVNVARFLKNPFPMLHRGYAEHGPVFGVDLGGMGTWVFVTSPELIRQLFKAPPDAVVSGELNHKTLGHMLGGNATFCLDGEDHFRRRKMVQPHFNGLKARDQVGLIRKVATSALESWRDGEVFSLLPWAHHTSLEVLINYVFSASEPSEIADLVEAFDRFASEGLRSWLMHMPALQLDLGPRSPWGRILEMRRQTRELVRRFVVARQRDREGFADRDIASEIVNTKQPDGQYLDEEAMVDELVNVIFAGHETTGTITSWSVECVASRPAVLAELLREQESVLGEEPIQTRHLRHLPYLDSVINEAIRYRPLAPMAGLRLIKQPFQLGEYQLEEGMVVTQCFPAMTRHEDIFENAEDFDPAHFFERRFGPYEWSPFGGGRRMCLGKGLAEVELAVFVTEIFRHFDVEIAQSTVKSVRDGVFFAPNHGLKLRVSRR